MSQSAVPVLDERTRCARCATELAPHALACPACGTLVHADKLRQLAAGADEASASGDLIRAREQWEEALRFLPYESQQHSVIRGRVSDLAKRISDATPGGAPKPKPEGSWWQRGGGALIAIAFLLLGKFKFLLLGLTKASTFISMFAFFGVYWSMFGWPLAAGLVVSIYIHEMGHVAMLRRLGIAAGAPLFIPGVGALVMLKQHVDDPVTDAKIGLAGPVWGLGAGLAALGAYAATDARIWLAIAQLTGFLNLFNLIPVWQLDGSRGFHALSRVERWIVVAAIVVALWATEQRLLFIVGGVAVWRAMQRHDLLMRGIREAEARLDRDGVETREEQLRCERSLTMREDAAGMVHLHARLDPETAAPVKSAIEAIVSDAVRRREPSPSGPGPVVDDRRSIPQIQADALAAIARHSLGCEQTLAPLAKATIVVRLDHDTLIGGLGHARIDGIDQPISATTARRMSADAELIPVVLGGEGVPLDLGRSARLFSRAQRLALAERDGGCASCGQNIAYVDAHHIRWWERDIGPTDLSNGVMLCSFCHHRVHREGWSIRASRTEVWFIPPPHIDPAQTPRLGGRARFTLPASRAAA